MRRIALINQKGGVGKTTTAVNLAACLVESGKRVLLIDMDPQANLTTWLLGPQSEDIDESLADVLLGKATVSQVMIELSEPKLTLVPSGLHLSGVERILAGEVGPESVLRRAIDAAEIEADVGDPRFDEFDYLIFDCPPSMGLLTLNALSAAREVIIPVQAKVLALNGVANLRRIIGVIRDRLNPDLDVTGILLCMTNGCTNLSREVEASARSHFGPLVYTTTIRENVRVAESPSHCQPMTLYASGNAATRDYRSLCAEVLAQERRREAVPETETVPEPNHAQSSHIHKESA